MNRRLAQSIVPLFFAIISVIGWYYAGLSFGFLSNEVMQRVARDSIMVLALIIPIVAGVGLNFGVVLGAMAAQIGYIVVTDRQIPGAEGLLLALVIAVILGVVFGWILSWFINRARGKEMIVGIVAGFLANGIYQLVFMVGYGPVIKSHDSGLLLSRGIGLRDTMDLAGVRGVLDKALSVDIAGVTVPVLTIGIVILAALAVKYILSTGMGQRFKAIGQDPVKAGIAGIDLNKTRTKAIIISTVLAAVGQFVYLQNIGMMNTYTAHRNVGFLAAAAILAGGATVRRAKVSNALIGTALFHTMFILSPQAGQVITGSPAIGEYFRSFVTYGTIAIALILTGISDTRLDKLAWKKEPKKGSP